MTASRVGSTIVRARGMVGVVVEAGFTKGTGRPGGVMLVAVHVVEE